MMDYNLSGGSWFTVNLSSICVYTHTHEVFVCWNSQSCS